MVTLHFRGNLVDLLPRKYSGRNTIQHHLKRRASVKDLVESLGVPHPEVERIEVNDVAVDFKYLVLDADYIDISPVTSSSDFFSPSLLRPYPLKEFRFVVDVNIGKIAAKLRMLGFDTLFQHYYDDAKLAALAGCQRRILLTRDCNLLKRNVVEFGHLVRARKPYEQLAEILDLYRLKDKSKPFSRCMRCNGLLVPVTKEEVIHSLQPLTKKYYHTFQQCVECQNIYWHGSHRDRMTKMVNDLL